MPLIAYLIRLPPHVAIGTSAVAVAASALTNLVGHARAGNVKWPCAVAFGLAGMAGAAAGAQVGKGVDGQALLGAFGVLMVIRWQMAGAEMACRSPLLCGDILGQFLAVAD